MTLTKKKPDATIEPPAGWVVLEIAIPPEAWDTYVRAAARLDCEAEAEDIVNAILRSGYQRCQVHRAGREEREVCQGAATLSTTSPSAQVTGLLEDVALAVPVEWVETLRAQSVKLGMSLEDVGRPRFVGHLAHEVEVMEEAVQAPSDGR